MFNGRKDYFNECVPIGLFLITKKTGNASFTLPVIHYETLFFLSLFYKGITMKRCQTCTIYSEDPFFSEALNKSTAVVNGYAITARWVDALSRINLV